MTRKKLPKQIKTDKKNKLAEVLEAAGNISKFDGNGAYTGKPADKGRPVQDADDL
ncbi:MAG: hypothetical protein LBT55_06485 [Clostridiaceae bacterium]|jgi:hypothetical protein|nr:hypothetical protein [Clostridiaceae bacterium]